MTNAAAQRTMSHAGEAPGPLAGVRIVDFTQLIAGPSATKGLLDLGADVIKVEKPTGELARSIGAETGYPPTFAAYNSGKRSMVIDLASPDAREAMRRVIATADVLIEAFRPGVMGRLGLDDASVRADHPELVYVSLSAYSARGRGARRPGVDAVLQAETGLMAITGDPDGPPVKAGFQVLDAATGLAIGQAVLAALLQRERTGVGASVELSLYEVGTYLQAPAFATTSRTGAAPARPGNTSGHLGAPTDLFEAADGHVMVAAYFPDQWVKFCALVGAPALTEDPRFRTNADRIGNKEELSRELAPYLAARSRREWAEVFTDAGVIAGPVLRHDEILEDADLRSLGHFRRVEDGVTPPYWLPALPYRSSAWGAVEHGAPPALGAHTREVLREAGLGEDRIDALQRSGAITATSPEGW